jgi:hypothetical protein
MYGVVEAQPGAMGAQRLARGPQQGATALVLVQCMGKDIFHRRLQLEQAFCLQQVQGYVGYRRNAAHRWLAVSPQRCAALVHATAPSIMNVGIVIHAGEVSGAQCLMMQNGCPAAAAPPVTCGSQQRTLYTYAIAGLAFLHIWAFT